MPLLNHNQCLKIIKNTLPDSPVWGSNIINKNKILDNKYYNAVFDVETIKEVMETFNESFEIEYRIDDNNLIID